MRGTAAAQFVGNEPLLETEPCPLQEATKEPLSCFRVSPPGYQDVENIAILIDCSPKRGPLALNLHNQSSQQENDDLCRASSFLYFLNEPINLTVPYTLIREDVRRRLSVAMPGGVYILSSACSVAPRHTSDEPGDPSIPWSKSSAVMSENLAASCRWIAPC